MNKLPIEVINTIMLYISHPIADILKFAVKTVNEELYEIITGVYEYGGHDFRRADEMSFAEYFFNDPEVSNYAFVDVTDLQTLSEYFRNH